MKPLLIVVAFLTLGLPSWASTVLKHPTLTSYTGCEDPVNGSLSCTGERLREGIVAADLSIYHLGQKIAIAGEGIFVIGDWGSAVKGRNHFDVYRSTKKRMLAWGLRQAEVTILDASESYSSKRVASKPIIRSKIVRFYCQNSKRSGMLPSWFWIYFQR